MMFNEYVKIILYKELAGVALIAAPASSFSVLMLWLAHGLQWHRYAIGTAVPFGSKEYMPAQNFSGTSALQII